MFCSKCGHDLAENAKFCPKCGTPVEAAPEAPVEETQTTETPVEETVVEEAPVEETPVEETPVEETAEESVENVEAAVEGASEEASAARVYEDSTATDSEGNPIINNPEDIPEPVKKAPKKGLIIGGIAVVVVAALAAVAYFVLGLFMSPEKMIEKSINKGKEALVEDYKTGYEDLKETYKDSTGDMTMSIEANLGEKGQELFNESFLTLVNRLLNHLLWAHE